MRIEGKLWIDGDAPVGPDEQEIADWLDDTIEAALTEYIAGGFFYVEGDQITFQLMDPVDDIAKKVDLREALVWDLEGYGQWPLHPEHKNHGAIGNAQARANLTTLRTLLISVVAEIDDALARPFVPEDDGNEAASD